MNASITTCSATGDDAGLDDAAHTLCIVAAVAATATVPISAAANDCNSRQSVVLECIMHNPGSSGFTTLNSRRD